MSTGVPVSACARCGRVAFPRRFFCPTCGGTEWQEKRSEHGRVEEVTILRRTAGLPVPGSVRLGLVRLDGGPAIVARLEGGATAGSRVEMSVDDGAPVAQPLRGGR